jgi:hypothetical protein
LIQVRRAAGRGRRAPEALWMVDARGVKHPLALLGDDFCVPEVDVCAGVEARSLSGDARRRRRRRLQSVRASVMLEERFARSSSILSVLNWLSEYGLSFDTCGRECPWSTPRSHSGWLSSSRSATSRDLHEW